MGKGGLDIGADAALLHIQQLCTSGAAIAYSGPGCAYRDKERTFIDVGNQDNRFWLEGRDPSVYRLGECLQRLSPDENEGVLTGKPTVLFSEWHCPRNLNPKPSDRPFSGHECTCPHGEGEKEPAFTGNSLFLIWGKEL